MLQIPFWIYSNMADKRTMFKPNFLLLLILALRLFWLFLVIWWTNAAILNPTLTFYVNKTTILQHSDLRGNFKLNFELYLNNASYYNMPDTRGNFKPNLLLLLVWRKQMRYFEFTAIWRTRAAILNFVIIL